MDDIQREYLVCYRRKKTELLTAIITTEPDANGTCDLALLGPTFPGKTMEVKAVKQGYRPGQWNTWTGMKHHIRCEETLGDDAQS